MCFHQEYQPLQFYFTNRRCDHQDKSIKPRPLPIPGNYYYNPRISHDSSYFFASSTLDSGKRHEPMPPRPPLRSDTSSGPTSDYYRGQLPTPPISRPSTSHRNDRPIPPLHKSSHSIRPHTLDHHPSFRSLPTPQPSPPVPRQILSSQQLQEEQRPIHTCAGCREKIMSNERVVQTNGVHLHVGCFQCWHCRMNLEHSQFYFVKETQRLYCHLDYHEKFSPRCNYCSTPIEGNAVFALDKHWHAGHFYCVQCNKPFKDGEDYCVMDNTAWCQPCYTNKTAHKCWKCSRKLINGEPCLEALGRNWCSKCFSCECCNKPFETQEFILREDGDLVCLKCEAKRIRNEIWTK